MTRLAPYRAGLKAGVGFALAAFVLGVSFGVLAEPIMGPSRATGASTAS